MGGRWARRLGGIAITAMLLVPLAHAGDDPLDDPGVQKALRAMANTSTWFHPDLFGMTAGMRRYAHKDYAGALKYFEVGAYYADKLSQLCLGLMYLNGEGVGKDPITAYAWLDLAAERDYPEFAATRDGLKAQLSPEQLARALEARRTLAERYGDAAAKPRMILQLRQGQMQMTGSHTGFDSGVNHLATKADCGPALVIGGRTMPQAGCGGDIYAKENWEPSQYFASRDREWKATVTVGAVAPQDKASAKTEQSNATPPPGDTSVDRGVQKH